MITSLNLSSDRPAGSHSGCTPESLSAESSLAEIAVEYGLIDPDDVEVAKEDLAFLTMQITQEQFEYIIGVQRWLRGLPIRRARSRAKLYLVFNADVYEEAA